MSLRAVWHLPILLVAAAAVALVGTSLAAQQAGRDGVISGRVVTEAGQPIEAAVISVWPTNDRRRVIRTTSGAAGRFVLPDVPTGRYLLRADKAEYLPAVYGSRSLVPDVPDAGAGVVVQSATETADLVIKMTRSAEISGVVRFFDGTPAQLASVVVLKRGRHEQTGQLVWLRVSGAMAETDHAGRYIVSGLSAGEYAVTAAVASTMAGVFSVKDGNPQGGAKPRLRAFAPAFYGDGGADAPIPVVVRSGEAVDSVDLTFHYRALSTVQGQATATIGRLPAGTAVRAFGPGGHFATPYVQTIAGAIDHLGRFTIPGLLPGSYLLEARISGGSGSESLFGRVPIQVVEGVDLQVALAMEPAHVVSGAVMVSAADKLSTAGLTTSSVSLVQSDGRRISGSVDATGRFVIRGIASGTYWLSVKPPSGLVVSAISVADEDWHDRGLNVTRTIEAEVVVTNSPNQLVGSLARALDEPRPPMAVVVFPEERGLWHWNSARIRVADVDTSGRFLFANLPAGDYRISVVTELRQNEWFEPEFLRALSAHSVRVQMPRRGEVTISLRTR